MPVRDLNPETRVTHDTPSLEVGAPDPLVQRFPAVVEQVAERRPDPKEWVVSL